MKIALSLLALPTVFGLKAAGKNRALQNYGNYQNGQYEENQEQEFAYLMGYESVYMTCDGSKVVQPADGGEVEYGAVVMRLCPKDSTCNSGKAKCSEGYGDYVIGIQTYMENFLEQFQRKQENQQQYQNQQAYDGQVEIDYAQLGDCREFNFENQNADQDGYDGQEQIQYYTGPICEDGDIKIALFTDQYCKTKSTVSFEDLAGIPLPWSDGIMTDEDCDAYMCYGADENGNYEYNEFCTDVIAAATLKCEEKMETVGPYGAQNSGCDSISAMLPRGANGGGNAGLIIIILLIVAVVGAGAWYFMQKKKSAASQEGLMM